jgi:hypothetical protein
MVTKGASTYRYLLLRVLPASSQLKAGWRY